MERKIKVFVTGSSGFLGQYLVNSLIKLPSIDKIYVLNRKLKEYKSNKVFVLVGDLENIEKYKVEILDVNYFFHLAANAEFGNGAEYDSINYLPTKVIINILEKSKHLKNFIYTSTIGAIDRAKSDNCNQPLNINSIASPTSVYGQSKLKSEQYLVKSHIPYTIFRPTWIYGHGMRQNSHINQFVTMVYRNSPIQFINFPGKVSLIYVGDLVKALANCIGNDKIVGKTFFGVTENIALGNIFNIISQEINHKNIKQIPLIFPNKLVGYIHSKMPLTVANLFVGYLWADDKDFIKLLGSKPLYLNDRLHEVVNGNALINGYWVVTGANSGIGRELVNILRLKNKKLILIDKNTDNLVAKKDELLFNCDLSNLTEVEKLVTSINKYQVYCLVNNAGIGMKKQFLEMSISEINSVLDVNIRAPLVLSRQLSKNIISNNGTIVNIGSSAGYNPLPGMSLYAATKAMIINLTEGLTVETKGRCNVILVSPAGTATNFQRSAGVNLSKDLLSPKYVAKEIFESVEKKKKNVILGGFKSKLLIFGSKFLPRSINAIIQGLLFKSCR